MVRIFGLWLTIAIFLMAGSGLIAQTQRDAQKRNYGKDHLPHVISGLLDALHQ